LAERVASGLSFQLYLTRAFSAFEWSNFVPPTIKTAVFGLVIGTVSSYFGYTTNRGAQGVGQAATNSVVVSSLLIILLDVVLIKGIFFLFPDSAL
jgi:phospholipid/cholesterol/gamma-HCH transport system permease protein